MTSLNDSQYRAEIRHYQEENKVDLIGSTRVSMGRLKPPASYLAPGLGSEFAVSSDDCTGSGIRMDSASENSESHSCVGIKTHCVEDLPTPGTSKQQDYTCQPSIIKRSCLNGCPNDLLHVTNMASRLIHQTITARIRLLTGCSIPPLLLRVLLIISLLLCVLPMARCEVEEDECEFNPCQNGGACQDFVNYYNCTCLEGTLGGNCQYMVNETCDNDICENNSTCTPVNVTDISEPDYIETFNCTCLPGFTGVFCESEIDYCAGQPCKENSTCESSRDILDYICFCIPGFTDKNCSTNIDDCAPEPCENDATCEDLINDFICHCASGWKGNNCSIDKDECFLNNSLCENGFCENLPGSFICNCSGTGFEGPSCENDIDECEDSVCENGAECENFPGGYSCNCTLGYEGEHCSVANCSHDNCENGGTCLISNEKWACACDEFYEGSRCEISGDCLNITCENGGTCYQSTDGTWANCTCIPGYDGVYCSNEIDECEGEPCLNGGTCTDLIAAFNCTCTDQYLGDTCQVYNNCSDDKFCLNDGVCNIGDDYAFICMCYGDYKGDRCEISPSPVNVGLIIGITIAALALVIVAIVGVAVVCHVRSKRATAGTYSPSRQEMDGSRVHMDQILKPPLEERLI